MDAAQRALAQRLFDEAIRAGTPDPGSWMATQTNDPEVIAEVRRLIGQHGAHPTHAEAGHQSRSVRLADPLIGATLGCYTIESLLGVGGMGRVYLAADTGGATREVAIKVLSRAMSGSIAMQRFQREAEVMQKLRHPAIAAFNDSGTYDDGEGAVPWFAMEYVPNAVTLSQWCERGNLGERARVGLVAQVSEAIGSAHRLGIVHRDLKPANVLVALGGAIKVIDFGVARCVGAEFGLAAVQTQTGQLVGTMQYMSPEQFEGDPRKIDQRADVYALGVILYELLSGTFPHEVRALPVLEAARVVCAEEAPDIRNVAPNCDPALASIVAQCLARRREARFADATKVEEALTGWLRGDQLVALEEEPAAEEQTTIRRASRPRAVESHVHRGVEEQAIRRSGGWVVPILSVVLVTAVALVATGVVTPQQIVAWWKTTEARWLGTGPSAAITPSSVESITVESDPSGASVTIDGTKIGVTPWRGELAWKPESTSATVVVELPGYQRETVVVAAAPRGGRTAPLAVAVRLVPASLSSQP